MLRSHTGLGSDASHSRSDPPAHTPLLANMTCPKVPFVTTTRPSNAGNCRSITARTAGESVSMNVPHASRSPALPARFFAVDATHFRNVRRGPSVGSYWTAAPKSLSGQTGAG